MGTLGFERGTAFFAQQLRFAKEFDLVLALARAKGVAGDPVVRQRLTQCHIGLEIMRFSGYRTITRIALDGRPGPESSVGKLHWSTWHQEMGELAADLLGRRRRRSSRRGPSLCPTAAFVPVSRADTIYAGSSEGAAQHPR